MGQSHVKSAKAPATAPARGKDAATLNPHLGPALKTHPSWSLGCLPRPEARGPQAEHGEARTFCPIRTVLPNLFTPPEFQHLRHKTGRAAHVFPSAAKEGCKAPAQHRHSLQGQLQNHRGLVQSPLEARGRYGKRAGREGRIGRNATAGGINQGCPHWLRNTPVLLESQT